MYPSPKQDFKRFVRQHGSTITARWIERIGGSTDPLTGAQVGADEYPVYGTFKALRHQEGASTKLRQFMEIQEGDLLLDIDPDTEVTLPEGQVLSGTLPLEALSERGVRFESNGEPYVQEKVGEELASLWSVVFEDQEIVRTILLRKAT